MCELSEQQFVSCDEGDSGCHGGLRDRAFEYAEIHNLCSEQSFPYKSGDTSMNGQCPGNFKVTPQEWGPCDVCVAVGEVVGHKQVQIDSLAAMKAAAALCEFALVPS